MAAALRDPWISTMVESELRTTVQSFQNTYLAGQPELIKGNRYCRPSGVEIRLAKNRQAQVIDFQRGLATALEAVLSDGTHRIHAVFNREAAEDFTFRTARDFHDIRGGIITLKKYYLIVNPALSPARLSLQVIEFKLQGSENSPVMGRPVDIQSLENVASFVEKLETLLAAPQENTQVQLSLPTFQDRSSQPSAGFATQVNEVERRAASSVPPQEPKRREQNSLAALLAFVSKGSEAARPEPAGDLVQKTALRPVPESKIAAINSKLAGKANAPRNDASAPAESSSSIHVGKMTKCVGSNMPSHMLNSSSGDSKKEKGQESGTRKTSPLVQPEPVDVIQLYIDDFVDQLQRDDAFDGLKRVPRRYVRIPKDQRAILERSDCWYEPQSGDRPLYANIPAKVMDDLTNFRNRTTSGPDYQRQELDHSSSDSEEECRNDSTAERSVNGEIVEMRLPFPYSPRDQGRIGQQSQNAQSPPAAQPNTKSHFLSSGPEVVDVTADDVDEDECPSWEATPEPERELPEPELNTHTRDRPPPSHPAGSAPTWNYRRQPYVRAPVNIPPSSPTIEEELELAVPYAVGDIVSPEDVQEDDANSHPQELPSTAPPGSNSAYIQVKRTPFFKSRSFAEASIRRSAASSKRAQDDISSDPVIPATFNDNSSSSKQVSSSTDHIPVDMDTVSGTQSLQTGHSGVHSQTTTIQGQDVIILSSLQQMENTTEDTVAEKTVPSHHAEREELQSRPSEVTARPIDRHVPKNQTIPSVYVSPHPDRHLVGLAGNINPRSEGEGDPLRRQMKTKDKTNPSVYISAYPNRQPAGLAGNIQPQNEDKRNTPRRGSTKTRQHSEAALPRPHITKGQRKNIFHDTDAVELSLVGKTTEQLILEEKLRARNARHNFKAQEELLGRTSEIDFASSRRPSSPAPVSGLSKRGNSRIPDASPQPPTRKHLSPTPDSRSDASDPEEALDYVHDRLSSMIGLAPFKDDDLPVPQETLPPRKASKPEFSSPLQSLQAPGAEYHEKSPLQKNVENASVAFSTPRRVSNVRQSPRESFGPTSPSSAQPWADDEDDQPSPRQSLGPGTPSSAQPQPEDLDDPFSFGQYIDPGSPFAHSQAGENGHEHSNDGMEIADSSPAKSDHIDADEHSPSQSQVPASRASALHSRSSDIERSPTLEVVQPEHPIAANSHRGDIGLQPAHQVSEPKSLPPMNPSLREPSRVSLPVEEAHHSKSLTFDGFVSTYPEYSGDKKCFTRALVCLEWLRTSRIPPWSICDDFIRVYAEWEPIVRELKQTNPEKVMKAYEYYDTHVKATVFERNFIDSKDKLAAVLSSLNPLYVQTMRDRYNSPAADNPRPDVPSRKRSSVAQEQVDSISRSPDMTDTVAQGGASPELGSIPPPRRQVRGPFFETPSQLHTMQQRKQHSELSSPVLETGRSAKKRRSLPWQQNNTTPDQNASSPQSRRTPVIGRSGQNTGSSGLKKRCRSNDQTRTTLPPALRASASRSLNLGGKDSSRSRSRDREVFETRVTTESVFDVGRLSPELPDLTERWVAQQLLTKKTAVEAPRSAERLCVPRKEPTKESDARRDSGASSNTDSPTAAKKRRHKNLAEFGKDLANRRRSGEMASRASTPHSTPAKRFCTKPKGVTPAKRVEPETQAWQY